MTAKLVFSGRIQLDVTTAFWARVWSDGTVKVSEFARSRRREPSPNERIAALEAAVRHMAEPEQVRLQLTDEHRRLLAVRDRTAAEEDLLTECERKLTAVSQIPFSSFSIRKLLWAASELSKQEAKEMDPLDLVSRMSKAELKALVAKARQLAQS